MGLFIDGVRLWIEILCYFYYFPGRCHAFRIQMQVTLAALGYAIFGVGVEIAGITVSKIIVKWFKGKEMGVGYGTWKWQPHVSGTTLAMVLTVPLADFFGSTDESAFPYQYSCSDLFCLCYVVRRYDCFFHLYFL